MRIGIDISPLTRNPTGVGHYTRNLLEHLLPTVADWEVIGLSTGLRAVEPAGLPLHAHRHVPLPTRAMYQLWQRTHWPAVERLLGPVQLYHATNYFLPPVKRAKRVVTLYDLAFLRMPELCSPAIVGPFSRLVRRFAHEADAILTCSQSTRTDIVELLEVPAGKVFVAHGAADTLFAPRPREEAQARLQARYGLSGPLLLFVSTVEPRKNVSGLLQAFAEVSRECPHQLVLIGREGWNQTPTAALIRDLGLEGRVVRLGYLAEHADLADFYSAADAFLFPSFYEGFGLPVLEAMACGCPVLASLGSSLPEVCGDAAVYVEPESVESITGGIRQLLEGAEHRESLSARGIVRAKHFTWEQCAKSTLEVYQRLLGQP